MLSVGLLTFLILYVLPCFLSISVLLLKEDKYLQMSKSQSNRLETSKHGVGSMAFA